MLKVTPGHPGVRSGHRARARCGSTARTPFTAAVIASGRPTVEPTRIVTRNTASATTQPTSVSTPRASNNRQDLVDTGTAGPDHQRERRNEHDGQRVVARDTQFDGQLQDDDHRDKPQALRMQ